MNRFDAIVIGAGVAGGSAALTLARGGLSVALVEADRFPRPKVCGEYVSATNMPLMEELGLADDWRRLAGPEIRRIALFSGSVTTATSVRPLNGAYGRGLGRDVLDRLLAEAAETAGAVRFQPWRAVSVGPLDRTLRRVTIAHGHHWLVLDAPVVIAAHGSWHSGPLPSQLPKSRGKDPLLGFKAHFTMAALPSDLMALLTFPGGYGGLVTIDRGRISLSCCITRRTLATLRDAHPGASAGAVLADHIFRRCDGARDLLAGAVQCGRWLATGPVRPGLRTVWRDDIFRIGNLACEAHPVIAEGISMALQSGWLLGREILASPSLDSAAQEQIARRYRRRLYPLVGLRIATAGVIARCAISPIATGLLAPTFARAPGLLATGFRLSGKYATAC